GRRLGRVVHRADVEPPGTLVERTCAGVARDDREPRARMTGRRDLALGVGEQQPGSPGAARRCVDVDLLDLVVDHDDEPPDPAVDLEHPGGGQPLLHARRVARRRPVPVELFGHATGVPVGPALVPDVRDLGHVRRRGRSDPHGRRLRHVATLAGAGRWQATPGHGREIRVTTSVRSDPWGRPSQTIAGCRHAGSPTPRSPVQRVQRDGTSTRAQGLRACHRAPVPSSSRSSTMPVLLYLLALAVFAQGTSEFVLAGLLPALAADLGVPLGQAGGLTSAYALGMVVGAPVMAALARRLSPRWALTAFLLLFVLAHVVGAVTDAFAVLLTTRVVAAVANAGFLAVALSTVAAVVPAERRARGLAVVLAGVTLALVAGAPAGALLGGQLGWRAAMWAIAAVSAPALVAVTVGTPTRPAGDGAPPARALDELAVLRRPRLQVTLALAVLVNSATFGTLTFLAVLATSRAGLPEALTPGLLAAFGVGAFGGVTAAGRLGDRYGRTAVGLGTPLLVV